MQKEAAIEYGSWFIGDTREWTMVRDPMVEDVDAILAGKGLVTSGPFKIIEWSRGQRVFLERNEDYWQGPAPTKYHLELYVPERSTRYLMFMNRDVDSYGPRAAEVAGLSALDPDEGIEIIARRNTGWLTIVYFNYDIGEDVQGPKVPSDFFDDIHMRKAFAYATPYDRFLKEVHLNYPERATGTMAPDWPGYYNGMKYDYDPEKALEEFKLAHGGKYYREGFHLTWVWQSWAEGRHDQLGRMIEETFQSFPDGEKYKFTYWMRRDPEQYDGHTPITPIGAENGPEPWTMTNVYHSKYGYAGYFNYKNPEVDAILEDAMFQINFEEAEKQYIAAQKIIEQDLPGLPIYYSYRFSVNRNYMSGVEYNPFWRGTYYYPMQKGN